MVLEDSGIVILNWLSQLSSIIDWIDVENSAGESDIIDTCWGKVIDGQLKDNLTGEKWIRVSSEDRKMITIAKIELWNV